MGNLFFSSCIWGHPHSTYAQRARGGVKPNAYDYAHGGRGFSKLHSCAKKIFVRPQNLKTFLSLGKRSYCIAIYFRVQKIESTHKGGSSHTYDCVQRARGRLILAIFVCTYYVNDHFIYKKFTFWYSLRCFSLYLYDLI